MSITFDTPIDLTGIQAPERLADLLEADRLHTPAFLTVLDQYRDLVEQLIAAEKVETEDETDDGDEAEESEGDTAPEPVTTEEPAQV